MRVFVAAAALVLAACAGTETPEETALGRFETAEALRAQGRIAEALPHYEFAVSARERWKEAHYRVAWCREALGDESGAVAAFEKVLRFDRQDETTLRGLARLYTHRGYPAQAAAALKALERPTAEDLGEIARLESLKPKRKE